MATQRAAATDAVAEPRSLAMRIHATPKTAALTGVWTVLGGVLLDYWEQLYPRTTPAYNVVAAVVGIFFFFIPVLLFVVGPGYLRRVRQSTSTPWQTALRTGWTQRRSLWTDVFEPIYVRMLCWFVTGAVALLAYGWVRQQLE
jgi:hypothetical protein